MIRGLVRPQPTGQMATTTQGLRHVKLYAVSSNADSGGASDFSQSVAPGLLQCKQSENLRVRLLSFDTRYTFPVIQAGYNSGFVLRSANVPTIVAGVNDTYTIYTQAGGTQRQIAVQMPAGQVTDQEIISSFAAAYGASLGITLTVSYAGTGAWTFSSPSPFSINWTLVQPNVQARFGFASAAYVAPATGQQRSLHYQHQSGRKPLRSHVHDLQHSPGQPEPRQRNIFPQQPASWVQRDRQ